MKISYLATIIAATGLDITGCDNNYKAESERNQKDFEFTRGKGTGIVQLETNRWKGEAHRYEIPTTVVSLYLDGLLNGNAVKNMEPGLNQGHQFCFRLSSIDPKGNEFNTQYNSCSEYAEFLKDFLKTASEQSLRKKIKEARFKATNESPEGISR